MRLEAQLVSYRSKWNYYQPVLYRDSVTGFFGVYKCTFLIDICINLEMTTKTFVGIVKKFNGKICKSDHRSVVLFSSLEDCEQFNEYLTPHLVMLTLVEG